jgi:hypothetical protein
MRFSDRVKAAKLPLSEVVVIGSGLLDQLELRRARDIDLVVSAELFAKLKGAPGYRLQVRHHEECLVNDTFGLEIWQSWGSEGVANFAQLYTTGQTLDGVRFVATKTLILQKSLRGTPKDHRDIELLEQYNIKHARII